jgi:Chitobiase/beta-hexosaminidase C-terminal domain
MSLTFVQLRIIIARFFRLGFGSFVFTTAAALVASETHASPTTYSTNIVTNIQNSLVIPAYNPVETSPVLAVPIIPAFWYQGMPNSAYLNSLGMKIIPGCISTNLAGTGLPDQTSVISNVNSLTALDPQPIVCIDIESLPVDIRYASITQVNSSIVYLKQVINWVRSANLNAKVGIYGVLPLRDYWDPNLYYTALRYPNDPWWSGHLAAFQQNYQAWLAANAYLAPLAQDVDYLFPSLYTFYTYYDNPASDGWPTFAFTNIAEARKYKKPVYPFLWPQFDNGSYQYLPSRYWQDELQYIRRYGDGIVVWGWGGFLNETWNPNAPWWLSVLNLANSLISPANSLVSARTLSGAIGLVATPPDGVYAFGQRVGLAAAGSKSIRYTLTTTWPNGTWPTCSTGTVYTAPVSIAKTEIIQAIACYADGSSVSSSFAYVIK